MWIYCVKSIMNSGLENKKVLLLSSIQKNSGPFKFPKCDTKSVSLYTKHCSRKNKRGNRLQVLHSIKDTTIPHFKIFTSVCCKSSFFIIFRGCSRCI